MKIRLRANTDLDVDYMSVEEMEKLISHLANAPSKDWLHFSWSPCDGDEIAELTINLTMLRDGIGTESARNAA